VRNHQASNNLKSMRIGDQAFFYHSQKGKEIVGIVKVVKEYYPDPSDPSGRFGMVDFKAVRPFDVPVTLAAIKEHPVLKDMALVRQSRLSVMPITDDQWALICELGGAGD
jgi:predicted RNA-binding protein with PUA-like domain